MIFKEKAPKAESRIIIIVGEELYGGRREQKAGDDKTEKNHPLPKNLVLKKCM